MKKQIPILGIMGLMSPVFGAPTDALVQKPSDTFMMFEQGVGNGPDHTLLDSTVMTNDSGKTLKRRLYSYDSKGFLTGFEEFSLLSTGLTTTQKQVFTFEDNSSTKGSAKVFTANYAGKLEQTGKVDFAYNENGQLTYESVLNNLSSTQDGHIYHFYYDEKGRYTGYDSDVWGNSEWTHQLWKIRYAYDDENNLFQVINFICEDDDWYVSSEDTYDAQGSLMNRVKYGFDHYVGASGSYTEKSKKTVYTRFANDSTETIQYTFENNDWKLSQKTLVTSFENDSTVTLRYKFENNNWVPEQKEICSFDADSNRVTIVYLYSDDTWAPYTKQVYKADLCDCLYYWIDDVGDDCWVPSWEPSLGSILTQVTKEGNKVIYRKYRFDREWILSYQRTKTYNNQQLLSDLVEYWSESSSTWYKSRKTEYEYKEGWVFEAIYDSDGNDWKPIRRTRSLSNEKEEKFYLYERYDFDKKDWYIYEKSYSWNKYLYDAQNKEIGYEVYIFDTNTEQFQLVDRVDYFFDEQGNLAAKCSRGYQSRRMTSSMSYFVPVTKLNADGTVDALYYYCFNDDSQQWELYAIDQFYYHKLPVSAIEQIESAPAAMHIRKVFCNGKLLIVKQGALYHLNGAVE